MTNDITNDLALLDDWLAGKGYGEEAGLCMRAMDLIRKQADEIEKLREANEHGRGLYYKLDEERQKLIVKVARLRAALKMFADEKTYITDAHIRAAKAALGE